tara:strand:- start:420 stop:740 length:321 start_codon:yes stop_codon:yes gene_type:complete
MALRNKYIDKNGQESTLYYRISSVRNNYEKIKGQLAVRSVGFYVEAINESDNSVLNGNDLHDRHVNKLGPTGFSSVDSQDLPVSGLVVKAYEHLKTVDHFSDAIDC